MTILLYTVSGLFLLMAFGLISAFGMSKNLGVLLGALVYGAGGMFAITMISWWPLLVGFALAILLRFVGADPTPS